jgi:hypothetical protein
MVESDNLTIEHLNEKLDGFRDEMMSFVTEQRTFNVHLDALVQSNALTKAEVTDMRKRIERIESRLGLSDAPDARIISLR